MGDESELKRKVEKEEKQMKREILLIFQKQACLTKKETGEEERRDVKDRWNRRFFHRRINASERELKRKTRAKKK